MLEKIKPEEFEHVFSLMERSFPAEEYRNCEEQKALLRKKNYEIYVVRASKEREETQPKQPKIQAFLAVWQLSCLTFIEHFAVDPALRSNGLGSLILTQARRLFPQQICLEVELPKTELAKRRIAFYERNGFSLNEYAYAQPPLSAGKQELPLLLMTSGGQVSKAQFETIKRQLYHEVYGALGA